MKRVDALPHGLINNVPVKLGETGGKLREYVSWLVGRFEHWEAATAIGRRCISTSTARLE